MRPFGNRVIKPHLIIATIVGLLLSYYLGSKIGSGQTRPVIIFFAVGVCLALFLGMRTNIWMIIPACWTLTGQIRALPLPFTVRDMAVMLAGGFFLVMIIFKIARQRAIYDHLDVILWINLGYLLTVFLRNPVGIDAFGSDLVGGKPYFNIVLGTVPYFILARTVVTQDEIRRVPYLLLGGSVVVSFLGVLTQYIPALTPFIAPFYSGIAVESYLSEYNTGETSATVAGEDRLTFLQGFGGSISAICISAFPPRTLLNPLYFWRTTAFLLSLVVTFLSGFRSAFFGIMLSFLISGYIRGKWTEVFRSFIPLFSAVVLVVALQGTFVHWPYTMQRTLSFLPGAWDEGPVKDAKGSSDWRFDMWRRALSTDRYIKNKIFGDGFGFTKRDLEIMKNADFGGTGFEGNVEGNEAFMIQGSFHSGPVSAIRFAGAVGLVLILILQCIVAAHSYKLATLAKGTKFYVPTLFIAIPAIANPFAFVLIFGAYDDSLIQMMFTIGMLKMIEMSMRKAGVFAKKMPGAASESAKPLIPALAQG